MEPPEWFNIPRSRNRQMNISPVEEVGMKAWEYTQWDSKRMEVVASARKASPERALNQLRLMIQKTFSYPEVIIQELVIWRTRQQIYSNFGGSMIKIKREDLINYIKDNIDTRIQILLILKTIPDERLDGTILRPFSIHRNYYKDYVSFLNTLKEIKMIHLTQEGLFVNYHGDSKKVKYLDMKKSLINCNIC